MALQKIFGIVILVCLTLVSGAKEIPRVVNVFAMNEVDNMNLLQDITGLLGGDKSDEETGTTPQPVPQNCKDLLDQGMKSTGWYSLYITNEKAIRIYCDMNTEGGGWLVFQRRKEGQLDFYKNWATYKSGFGLEGSEFWLGNDNINLLTNSGTYELRIDMMDKNNQTKFALYDSFKIDDESGNYRLFLGTYYGGTAGDSMGFNNYHAFSTYDRDNDESSSSCSSTFRGAWWYASCTNSNLNGRYYTTAYSGNNGIRWPTASQYSLKFVEMKIRPRE
ncbi:FCN2 protein, partial [Amia calva]|nr:FCN2 protein [Amia calva]